MQFERFFRNLNNPYETITFDDRYQPWIVGMKKLILEKNNTQTFFQKKNPTKIPKYLINLNISISISKFNISKSPLNSLTETIKQ